MTTFELSVRFFLQLAVILIVCRALCGIAVRFSPPAMVTTWMVTPMFNDFYRQSAGMQFKAAA